MHKRPCITYMPDTACGTLSMTVAHDAAGKVVDILAQMGKAGDCKSAFARAISSVLRSAVAAGCDMRAIAAEIGGIGCHRSGADHQNCLAALSAALVDTFGEKVDLPRPAVSGAASTAGTGCGTLHFTDGGDCVEVVLGAESSCAHAWNRALGSVISSAIRHGVSRKVISGALSGTSCPKASRAAGVTSCIEALAGLL